MMASKADALNHQPDLSSRTRDWDGIVADLHWWHEAGEAISSAPDHEIVAVRVAGVTPLVQRRAGVVHESIVGGGNVTIHPRGMESHWSWTRPGAILLMRLPPALVAEVHRRSGDPHDLPNCFGARDQAVESYAQLLISELHGPDHPTRGLRWQSLSLAFAAHMVDHYADRPVAPPPAGTGLTREALKRVTNFIEDGWREEITLQKLAEVAGVSRFHFVRLFKASLGMTPMEFVERSRLDRARALIAAGRHRLADVALLTGFTDQSHFSRRFRKAFGLTPGAFARSYR